MYFFFYICFYSINQDWANRLAGKLGNYKGVEGEIQPAVPQTENNNIWKSKHTQVLPTPTLTRGADSALLSIRGEQTKSFSTQTPSYKHKKGKEKKRLQLLMFISETQLSPIVWGKSWQYNKSLPPAEGTPVRSRWGQSWMFATQQLCNGKGMSYPNGPNMRDPQSLHLWKKPDCRVIKSQEAELSLHTKDWQMSWRKSDKNIKKEDEPSINGDKIPQCGFFTLLVETQHHNETCFSEWSESWRSTKPESHQKHFAVPSDSLLNKSNKQDKNMDVSSRWEECWRLVNHHGRNKSKLPPVQKSHSSEWANSWKTAVVVSSNHKKSAPSLRQIDNDTHVHSSQKRESHLHKIMVECHDKRYRDVHLQFHENFKDLADWSKSWLVAKNISGPSEEIEKVLNALPQEIETWKVKENIIEHYLTSEKADKQVKHNVIYNSEREFTQSELLHLKNVVNVSSFSEWGDSWKTLKHRMKTERSVRPGLTLIRSQRKT